MKRLIAMLGMLVLATGATVYAQQPATPADPHHPPGQAQAPAPPAGQETPKPGAPMGGMMPMMQMCREMMGGHSIGRTRQPRPTKMCKTRLRPPWGTN